jgi:hypothetical protein
MNAMEPSTTSQPSTSEAVPADSTDRKAYGERHLKPVITPGLLKSPILPEWLRKTFRRTETPAAR